VAQAKILFVDDEVDLHRLIKQRFRKQIEAKTLDFVFACNGIEALNKLQQDRDIDMVLTDINMPEMDGLTFIHHLPKIDETLRAVVVSAYDDMSRIRQAMNEGAFDFITKPIDFQDLEKTIEKTLKFVHQLKAQKQQTQQFQDELKQAAFCDSLTGLPNRAWFFNHLQHIFKQREEPRRFFVSLLFVDLDAFKQINDSLGHLMGDELLKQFSQRMLACLREGDFAARLAGDEFVVLLEGIPDLAIATGVADRILKQLVEPFHLGDNDVVISASIGVAVDHQNYRSPELFLQAADIAMYAAKSQGKGRYVVHDTNQDRTQDLEGTN
jgi:diguanylate cyclase (GGDEF)-like protein